MATGAQHLRGLLLVLRKLRAQHSERIGDVVQNPLYAKWNYQGIYEIRDAGDKETVYIGKTNGAAGGVAQRIYDHAYQVNIHNLIDRLEITRQSFADYRVRSIEIQDSRFRGLAECFGIAVCDPKGNRVG